MATFFKHTRLAANALYGDFKFTAYYDKGFQLDAITAFFNHIIRSLCNLILALLKLSFSILSILNPLAWPGIPFKALAALDHLLAFSTSVLTVVLHPVIFILRSITSMVFGYQETTNPSMKADEEADLELALKVFPDDEESDPKPAMDFDRAR
jgi:hypothetical protein